MDRTDTKIKKFPRTVVTRAYFTGAICFALENVMTVFMLFQKWTIPAPFYLVSVLFLWAWIGWSVVMLVYFIFKHPFYALSPACLFTYLILNFLFTPKYKFDTTFGVEIMVSLSFFVFYGILNARFFRTHQRQAAEDSTINPVMETNSQS